jgi:hypothetical protein
VNGLVVVTQTCDIVRACIDKPYVEVFFWFVREEDETLFEGADWSEMLKGWLGLVPARGRLNVVDGAVVTLDDMTARDCVFAKPPPATGQ